MIGVTLRVMPTVLRPRHVKRWEDALTMAVIVWRRAQKIALAQRLVKQKGSVHLMAEIVLSASLTYTENSNSG